MQDWAYMNSNTFEVSLFNYKLIYSTENPNLEDNAPPNDHPPTAQWEHG